MSVPSDAQLRERASEILARSEYAQYRVDEGAWMDFYRRLDGLYLELWERLQALHIESPALYWAILAGLFGIAVLLLVHMIWTIRIALRTSPPPDAPEPVRGSDWGVKAEELAAAGHFLDAARCYQLASLELLIARGRLELRRSDPNPTLRERVAESALPQRAQAEFRVALDALEAQWFRDREDDPDLFRAWRSLHGSLREALG